jgi:hypothetical protein
MSSCVVAKVTFHLEESFQVLEKLFSTILQKIGLFIDSFCSVVFPLSNTRTTSQEESELLRMLPQRVLVCFPSAIFKSHPTSIHLCVCIAGCCRVLHGVACVRIGINGFDVAVVVVISVFLLFRLPRV